MRDQVQDGYQHGEHFERYRADRSLHPVEQRFMDTFLERLPGDRVLDMGCGSGVPFTAYLVQNGCAVTGVDLTPKHVEQAQELVPGATFIQGDFTDSTVLPDMIFDGITSFYALVHIPREEHAALFQEMHELLHAKGMMLITISEKARTRESGHFTGPNTPWSAYAPEKTLQLIEDAGFSILNSAPVKDTQDLLPNRLVLARHQ